MLDQSFCLAGVCHAITLSSKDVVGLLEGAHPTVLLLILFLEEAALERLRRVKVDLLCHDSLLVL